MISLFLSCFSFSDSLAQGNEFYKYDWNAAIDTLWGEGLPTKVKLEVLDSIWTTIDQKYACFNNLDINWDSLKNVYYSEIEKGVSEGRFTAILNHLGLKLKEAHTSIVNPLVNYDYNPKSKKPLIFSAFWGLDEHFGAGLSVMTDSSLLVYAAEKNHPLGLEPGDIIIGYEGIPWKKLYKVLLSMELPMGFMSGVGGNEKSITDNWLKGAGSNWHLFDTIDIVKYNSKDTLHLPTNLLDNRKFTLHHSDQLPVAGIKFHKQFQDDKEGENYTLSWGVVDSTKIGYIYIWSWYENDVSMRFYNALDSLINVYKIDGLILDMRANRGGFVDASNAGLKLLFPKSPSILGLAKRDNPKDHFSLVKDGQYIPYNSSNNYFDKPIAVLTGSFAISAADFICYRLREHPRVKIFGSSTSASFATSETIQIGIYRMKFANTNGYSEINPDQYLTHRDLIVDKEVNFTPDDVRRGFDTIVKEALFWINSQNAVSVKDDLNVPADYSLSQNYPNPFNPSTKIKFSIPRKGQVSLKVFDILGKLVTILVDHNLEVGNYEYEFKTDHLSSGVYFYSFNCLGFSNVKKLIVIK